MHAPKLPIGILLLAERKVTRSTADSQLESRIEEQSNHSLNLNWALGKILNKRKRQPL